MKPSHKLVAAALIAAALTVVGPAPAGAAPFTIRTSDGWIKRIGSYTTLGGFNGGLLRGAIEHWGSPSSRESLYGDNGCRVSWQRLRIRAVFANFGLGDACEAEYGRLQKMTVRSRRFKTTRGIRVGSRSSAIPRRHRLAEFRWRAWWITSVILPYGDDSEVPTIKAIVSGGRVRALKLWIGAAGD